MVLSVQEQFEHIPRYKVRQDPSIISSICIAIMDQSVTHGYEKVETSAVWTIWRASDIFITDLRLHISFVCMLYSVAHNSWLASKQYLRRWNQALS